MVPPRQNVGGHEPDIVPGAFVLWTWVAEADDEHWIDRYWIGGAAKAVDHQPILTQTPARRSHSSSDSVSARREGSIPASVRRRIARSRSILKPRLIALTSCLRRVENPARATSKNGSVNLARSGR